LNDFILYYLAPIHVFPLPAVVVVASLHSRLYSCHTYPVSKLFLHNLYYVLLKTSGVTLSAGVAQLG
jgi:hypothetical protein